MSPLRTIGLDVLLVLHIIIIIATAAPNSSALAADPLLRFLPPPPVVPHCGTTSFGDDAENPSALGNWQGTIRSYDGCLQRHGDRFVVVTPVRSRASPQPLPPCRQFRDSNETLVLSYLSSDLCRLGHTTKDPPYLMTFLLDYLAPCAASCQPGVPRLRVHLTLFFANACMSFPNKRLDSSFRHVILGWFHAVFSAESPFIALMSSWGIDFIANANNPTGGALRVEETFYEEALAESSNGLLCYPKRHQKRASSMRILVRWNRFRWFRTRAQAALFRLCLLRHFNIPTHPGHLSVMLLSRPNERRFDEQRWHDALREGLQPCGIPVTLQTFISLPYAKQASWMHNTSVLIGSHGAGMVNMVAMLPGSVVVELFPHGFRYSMYEELARLLNLHYISYESPVVWPARCCRVGSEDASSNFTPPLKSKMLKTSFGSRSCKECDIRVLEEDMDAIMHDALGLVTAQTRSWES